VRDSKIKKEFECPNCEQHLKKRDLKKTHRYPVMVGYRCCEKGLKESTAPLDDFDRAKLTEINGNLPADIWYPTAPFPPGVNTSQAIAAGIDTVDKAYTPRGLWAMAYLWNLASKCSDEMIRNKLLFTLTSLYQRVTLFSEFRFWGGSGNTANFAVPSIANEQNVFRAFARKADTISWYFRNTHAGKRDIEVSTQSACHLSQIPDKSIDYVFTDPPFGANINYSEMNFLWESWLQVYTDTREEAIVNRIQKKDISDYRKLLTESFAEIHRILKDQAWLSIVFHNSSDRVWTALQDAIQDAAFVVYGTQTFDKEHGTFKQFVSDNAVGYDLVLHCRKSAKGKHVLNPEEPQALDEVRDFIRESLKGNSGIYVVHYQHVNRHDEFNYRRLYANWLARAVLQANVHISFNQFRGLVDETIRGLV
jgi:adenine-specific DNA methylase